ncbi:hypothetical protein [Prosthecobacter dejongeii]|uniref:Uncharacterized protein n=1 Tax=Prosthecobacter dejongeii TaxID=48465 RepID=A0A7W7YPS2_9BACT|nr:hypothetical protein [Prosthecobacter dejongeii]MBB5039952.1 hypothetical protein [Prosthecobacter dejongeii]
MKKHSQSILRALAVFIAVCSASCDKQTEQTAAAASSKKTPTITSMPANLTPADGGAKLPEVRTAWKQAASVSILWTDGNAEAAKRQLSELVELHQGVSETPAYENALVSADCEVKLYNSIVPGLISGHLSPDEARSLLASIASNRFSRSSLITMLKTSAPDSKQARALVAELQSGKPVNLIEASNAFLLEQDANLLLGPTPDTLGEFLDKPNAARALQYHALTSVKLDVAGVIAAYASAGGNLHADDAAVTAGLLEKVPKLINAPGLLSNRPISADDVVHFLKKWRNGSFVK